MTEIASTSVPAFVPSRSPLRLPSPDDAARSAAEFAAAVPFPHVVVDDLLDAGAEVARAFPVASWDGWRRFGDEYQRGKRSCDDLMSIPTELRELIIELSTPAWLEVIERITGIEGLIPDPYLEGGGLHASGPGGVLAPHTDFHLYNRLGLYRQVNLILYLNRDWRPGDGGELELFGPNDGDGDPVRRVDPIWGRAVIFRTDDRSVHGFTNPIGEHAERRSIALYYYTATESHGYAGDTNTVWRRHERRDGVAGIRAALYRSLLWCSRALSWAAHRANPNRF